MFAWLYFKIYCMFEIRLYLLPMRLLFSQPLVFCPKYMIFVEMNIFKTLRDNSTCHDLCILNF